MPKGSVVYSYDFANRIARRNSEFVVHDDWQIVLMLDAKGNVKDRNLWGANQDELIAVGGQFTLCDHLGSVRDVVDAEGKVLNHVEYNAFGKVTKQTEKSLSVFGYTGKFFDNQSGLQWNINRWYDAETGRWISEDPIGFEAGDISLCRYVMNNPSNYMDHDGLIPWRTRLIPGSGSAAYDNNFGSGDQWTYSYATSAFDNRVSVYAYSKWDRFFWSDPEQEASGSVMISCSQTNGRIRACLFALPKHQ